MRFQRQHFVYVFLDSLQIGRGEIKSPLFSTPTAVKKATNDKAVSTSTKTLAVLPSQSEVGTKKVTVPTESVVSSKKVTAPTESVVSSKKVAAPTEGEVGKSGTGIKTWSGKSGIGIETDTRKSESGQYDTDEGDDGNVMMPGEWGR